MSAVDDVTDRTGEYHARQRANLAENAARATGRDLPDARSKVSRVRTHLETALELLDSDADPAVRKELAAALGVLAKLRL